MTSTSGTGISSEGGTVSISNTTVSECAGHGLALYADLEGVGSKAVVQNSRIARNALNGILVREDSTLLLQQSVVSSNQGYGLAIKVELMSRNKLVRQLHFTISTLASLRTCPILYLLSNYFRQA